MTIGQMPTSSDSQTLTVAGPGDVSSGPDRPFASFWRAATGLYGSTRSVSARRSALQIALAYAALAVVWILGSDYLLSLLVSDPQQAASLQTAKGTAFVLLTGGLIFLLVRAEMNSALRANATLRDNMQRLGFVTEHAKVGYWHWDIPSNSFEWSPVGLRLLGIPANDAMSLERFYAAVHPDDRARVQQAMQQCVDGTSSPDYHFEFRAVWPDGSVRWIEAIGGATFTDGKPTRMAGISFDITERRQADVALRESVERLRFVTEHAKVGYWHWDVASDGADWSPVCKHLFGIPVDQDVTYEAFMNSIHPDDRSAVSDTIADCFSGKLSPDYHVEYRIVWSDGSIHWIEAIGSVIFDNDLPVRMAGISFDITERKEMDLRLAEALRAANAANEAKSQFVANMSHELRTPMGGVIGMLEVLLRTQLGDEQRDQVTTALKSARDLTHVLNDVLDVSAVEAGRFSIEHRPFDVRALLSEKAALFNLRGQTRGIALNFEVDPALPSWIDGDARRFRQVMRNLVGNALKYTHQGHIDVDVRYDADRKVMRVEVRDTGIGMSDAVQANLFQRFYQADASASRRYEGSGLGLVISRQLIELMGGRIGVHSKEGQGSTFWFELPAVACDAPGVESTGDATAFSTRPLRVLVAEDNPTARKIISALLAALGHSATLVEDGAPAVEAAASGNFDVILMDVMMPGMDGSTATRKIRELGGRAGSVPVIALTADVLFGRDGKYLSTGMTDCLSKPIDVPELAAALHRAAGQDSDRKEVAA